MSPFDSLASAQDAFWSFFARGPAGFAAQFFIEPNLAAPSLAPGGDLKHQQQPPMLRFDCGHTDTFNGRLPTAASTVMRLVPELAGPQWLSNRFEHDDMTHRFKMYVPSGYHGEQLPMIVMLHGAQQDADDFAAGTEMNASAEAQGFIVVYPEQSESANPLRCWNWFRSADRMHDSGETAMVVALTREVMATYNVDNSRVYVAGMSAGGAMAVNLVVTHPDLYAAAAIHSGVAFGVADEPLSALCAMNDGMGHIRLPETLCDGTYPRVVPLIVFHGDADNTVHPLNSSQIVAMSALLLGDPDGSRWPATTHVQNAENGHAYTRDIFHDRAGVSIGERWLVHGLGHAWSGGHPSGTYTDSRGPHATKEIVRFFGQFALPL